MALYLGNLKQKLNFDNASFHLNLYSLIPIVNGIILKATDNYILQDSTGLYLTAKEDE